MTKWVYKIPGFRKVLNDDNIIFGEKKKQLSQILKKHSARIKRRLLFPGRIKPLLEIANRMLVFEGSLDGFDKILEDFYNWCDANKIWIAL